MKVLKNKLLKYVRILSTRDKAILNTIKICKFIKTDQIKRLHCSNLPTPYSASLSAIRALRKLHGYGLIQPLKRRIGGVRAGSSSYVWTLRAAGEELLQMVDNNPPPNCRKQVFEPTFIFLKHTLAVTELYTYLSTETKLLKAEFEPDCWRNYSNAYGSNATLKPDLYAVTSSEKYEDYWFFEIDLDTEAPSRIVRKCESYGKYYLAGDIQKQIGVFPKVVWIVTNEKRKLTLQRYIYENISEYCDLFSVIILEELHSLFGNSLCQ